MRETFESWWESADIESHDFTTMDFTKARQRLRWLTLVIENTIARHELTEALRDRGDST